jgi:hypothetical protein
MIDGDPVAPPHCERHSTRELLHSRPGWNLSHEITGCRNNDTAAVTNSQRPSSGRYSSIPLVVLLDRPPPTEQRRH